MQLRRVADPAAPLPWMTEPEDIKPRGGAAAGHKVSSWSSPLVG